MKKQARIGWFAGLIVTLLACKTFQRTEASGSASPSASAAPVATAFGGTKQPVRGLEVLPAGAAVYGAVQLAFVDRTLAVLPLHLKLGISRELQPLLGGTVSTARVAETFGLDPKRPILFAMVPGAGNEAVQLTEQAHQAGGSGAKVTAALAALARLPQPAGGGVRIVLPVVNGGASKLLALMKKQAPTAQVFDCPGDPRCQAFGASPPAFVAGGPHPLAVYTTEDQVRIDVAPDAGAEASQVAWLAWLGSTRGGPGAHCQELDGAAVASVCLSTAAIAPLGKGQGAVKVLGAVNSDFIDDEPRARILAEGLQEISRIDALAAPLPHPLTDATYHLTSDGGDIVAVGTFLLDAATAQSLGGRLGQERCATTATAVRQELLTPLREGLGVSRHASLSELRQHSLEAGWAGPALFAAGQWPLILPHLGEVDAEALRGAGVERVCARVQGQRLWVRLDVDPSKLR